MATGNDFTWNTIEMCVLTRTPVVIWGEPGIGKTRRVEQMSARLRLPCETVIASIREPSDFGGLPALSDDGVFLHAPAWAKRLARQGTGTLFLDELSTAPAAVQAALLRVALDRVVGDLELPKDVAVVAAANPPECAAGGFELSPPLANRFIHVEAEVDVDAWLEWCGEQVREGLDLCASYIKHSPQSLHRMPTDRSSAGLAWPSPRSWDQAGALIDKAIDLGVSPRSPAVGAMVCGAVGEGAGIAFTEWVRSLDLPDPEWLLAKPHKWKVPRRGDVVYATLSSMLHVVKKNPTEERWRAAWKVLSQAIAGSQPDVAAGQAKALAKMRPAGAVTPKEVSDFMPLLHASGVLQG